MIGPDGGQGDPDFSDGRKKTAKSGTKSISQTPPTKNSTADLVPWGAFLAYSRSHQIQVANT